MKNTMMRIATAGTLLSILVAIAGCGGAEKGAKKKEADLVYVNWTEGIAYTHLAQAILQDKMGYDVKIMSVGVGPAYASVAKGDKDAFMECWLPTLHRDYVEKYKNKLVDLGAVYKGTRSGLVVPQYVTIDKISQLNENSEKFDGKIIGIDAGAGIMKTTEEELMPTYNLDMKLIASSGPAMAAELKGAIANEEWIVVTGWKPHWMFGRWDLKFLEQDPDKTVWGKGAIHIMGRPNIEEDKPELAQFLRNMLLTDAQLADLMLQMRKSDEDVEVVVRKWMQDNPDVINSWIPAAE